MKKLSILFLAFVTLIGLNSCTSDDDVVFIANPDAEGIHFTSAFAGSYDLTEMDPTDVVERFVWNEIDVDVPTNINYELQGSLTETFDNPEVLGTTSTNNLDVTAEQLIKLTRDAGLTEDNNTITLYFKVVASPGTAGEMAHESNVVSFSATIPVEPVYLNLYLVGDASPTGWDNTATSNNYPLFRDPVDENIYYYTGKLGTGGIKVIEKKGAWAPQYGGENGNLVYRPTEDVADPSPIAVPSPGYYTFTIDIEAMTYTLESYDASGAATFTTIGYIGDATPGAWDNDTDLTQSTFDPHIWYVNGSAINDGEMKFRAANDWGKNWGGNTFPSGTATQDGPNIPVVAGNYDIWFNDLTGRYILIEVGE
ncbi:SusF/SusE family outer membrane protein [Salinimicrobium soli]|uniref:SusF/SusE family outer membrane protein n=1 Tax=Salinimicrobium soli TaxID=1254399 RepID=UPI003AAA6E33